jgi:hypothetical protein
MRRLIASIALAGLAVVFAAPFAGAAAAPGMACCHGNGEKMVCCAPSAGCQMKGCAESDRATMLPALPPALLESRDLRIEPSPRVGALAPIVAVAAALAADPPDRPPRG